jgi:hypothetical protein
MAKVNVVADLAQILGLVLHVPFRHPFYHGCKTEVQLERIDEVYWLNYQRCV